MYTTDDGRLRRAQSAVERCDATRARDEVGATIRRHKPRIWRLCLRVSQDPDRAVLLTRRVIREVWNRLPTVDLDEEKAWVWLTDLARTLAFDGVRAPGPDPLLEDGVLAAGSRASVALRQLSMRERGEVIAEAAASLPPEDREFVQLRYVERLPTANVEGILERRGLGDQVERIRADLGHELHRHPTVAAGPPMDAGSQPRPPTRANRPD
jgi:DNA-directed RNA polymerase specialized sigma24 family protein